MDKTRHIAGAVLSAVLVAGCGGAEPGSAPNNVIELDGPSSYFEMNEDLRLGVDDPLFGSIDHDGTWRRTIRMEGEAELTSSRLLAVAPDGYIAIQTPSQRTGMETPDDRGYAYRRVSADGVLGDSIWTSPRNDYLVYSSEDIIARMDRPFGRTTHCAVAIGVLACAWSADLIVHRIDLRGDTLPAIRIGFDPIPVTAAEKALEHRNAHEWFADILEVPDTRPALGELAMDDAGRIWLKVLVSKDEGASTYWVVDPDARTVAESVVDGNVDVKLVRGDLAYGVLTVESGEEYVVRYRVDELPVVSAPSSKT